LPTGGTNPVIVSFNIDDPSSYQTLTPAGDTETAAAFSPDGFRLARVRFDANGQTPGIHVSDAGGGDEYLALQDPTGNINSISGALSWSPFLPKETVVAASGSTFYHQSASGFLLTQTGDLFGSMIAFTAATPSSAAIQTPAPSNGAAQLAFTIAADSVTSLGYTNGYFNPGTILTLSSTPSAVVTIDGTTGQVDVVAPAVAKPSLAKNPDGTVTYSAYFEALYDCNGKNLAPKGAAHLTVNPNTGKLVSFH
jgi:hypothetical protein